jgi:ATPase subunit of ABC transporter with duplicated ATPase domains
VPRIVLDRIVFTYDGNRPFPRPIDAVIDGPGWIGLVGSNGAGKTSLLNLLGGALVPERGRLRVEPGSLVLRRVAQTHPEAHAVDGLDALAHDASRAAQRLRARLDLVPEQLARWSTLSCGERQRWLLAGALLDEPDLLLCDEPSNHLDAGSRELIVRALASHRGLGVLVSHDRALLDALTDRTLFVEDGAIELRPGNYGAALAERERERAYQEERFALARDEQRRAARKVEAARRKHESAERGRRSSTRKRNHKDHDASSMARKYRADRAASSQAQALRRSLAAKQRRDDEVTRFTIHARVGGTLFVDWQPPRKRVLFRLGADEVACFGPGPWTRLPDGVSTLQLERDQKVWLRGPNGAGKTSLLSTLLARARASIPRDRVLWLPQELGPSARLELVGALRCLDRTERGHVLRILAATGVEPEHVLRSPSPSPGEARKLALALGLARKAWLLLLDEPTNHLDLPAIRAIEQMLLEYPGALVLVSHDTALAEHTTSVSWNLEHREPGWRSGRG